MFGEAPVDRQPPGCRCSHLPTLEGVRLRRPGPRPRLALLLAVLLVLFVAFWLLDVLSREQVRAWIEPFGAAGPLVYVVLSVALGIALVPGPLLAGAAGLLFGTLTGTAVSITAATLTAVLALLIARATGAAGALSGPRIRALADALRHHGLAAVIVQRLAPAVPDAPCSYLAGLLGIRVWQIALGTLIGSAPRAFSYVALGDALGEPGSPLAAAGLAGLALTGVVGTVLAARMLRRGPRTP
jgi:uncharacterized membrane protein YdjX (TVP38/TMEM64 family)